MKKTLEVGDLIKISYNESEMESPCYYFMVINELKTTGSALYIGTIVIPSNKRNRISSFFEFQVKNNFGPITIDELIEKYPEYLI